MFHIYWKMLEGKDGNYEFYYLFRGKNSIYFISTVFSRHDFISSLFLGSGRIIYFSDASYMRCFSCGISMADLTE